MAASMGLGDLKELKQTAVNLSREDGRGRDIS